MSDQIPQQIPSFIGIANRNAGDSPLIPQQPISGQSPVLGQTAVQSPPPPPPASVFAEQLRSHGFDIPAGMSDYDVVQEVARQIDESNRIMDEMARQRVAPQPQTQVAPPQNQPLATSPRAVQPQAVPSIQPAVVPAFSDPPKQSPETRMMIQNGLLSRDASGQWKATNPGLQVFADEQNQVDAWRQSQALMLLENPGGYLNPHVQKAIEPYNQQIIALQQQIAEMRSSREESQVDSWVNENSHRLFVNGDRTQQTDYARRYNQVANQVVSLAGRDMSRAEIHKQTLEFLRSDNVPEVAQAPVPPPQPQVAQQPVIQQPQSFLQQAAQHPPRNGHNRLTEYTAAHQSTGTPSLPIGKGGAPSLARLIQQKAELQRVN